MSGRRLRVATRGSTLARIQTDHVIRLLGEGVEVEPVVVETLGDRRADAPIWRLGGQGVFVKEVQAAVLDGRADLAVHSAKDLPSAPAGGLVIAAVPEREDPRDALVGAALDDLPPGGRVATGSVRRRAQLAWLRPDLTFAGLRGNIETRLAKAAGHDAVVVAAAALRRLGRDDAAAQVLDTEILVPQVGQGALAVECRTDDGEVRDLLAIADHPPSARAVAAERAYLAEVGGGCDLPVGAHATIDEEGVVRLTGLLAAPDGRVMIRHTASGEDGEALGRAVARHLLDEAGGAHLLAAVALAPADGAGEAGPP
ncbi:MAG TPA: hydroxymethylbilane synthase [Acidimicrobiales bacterium]|nr:hydroxymethylbilane synthase [Acidimicrobiales bacterium]